MAKRNIEYFKISAINDAIPAVSRMSGHYLRMFYKGHLDGNIKIKQVEALQAEITTKYKGAMKELTEYKSRLKQLDNEQQR
jgi:hypothetical protein